MNAGERGADMPVRDGGEERDGYLAALTNFRFIANAVLTTDQAVDRLSAKA